MKHFMLLVTCFLLIKKKVMEHFRGLNSKPLVKLWETLIISPTGSFFFNYSFLFVTLYMLQNLLLTDVTFFLYNNLKII